MAEEVNAQTAFALFSALGDSAKVPAKVAPAPPAAAAATAAGAVLLPLAVAAGAAAGAASAVVLPAGAVAAGGAAAGPPLLARALNAYLKNATGGGSALRPLAPTGGVNNALEITPIN